MRREALRGLAALLTSRPRKMTWDLISRAGLSWNDKGEENKINLMHARISTSQKT